MALLWILFVIVAVTALYDLLFREIPHVVPIAVLALGGTAQLLGWERMAWTDRAFGLGAGFTLSLALYVAGGIGGGDVKLLAAMGLVLGWKAELSMLFYMACFGGVLAMIAKWRRQAEYAYGPAIALGLLAFILRGPFPGGW